MDAIPGKHTHSNASATLALEGLVLLLVLVLEGLVLILVSEGLILVFEEPVLTPSLLSFHL